MVQRLHHSGSHFPNFRLLYRPLLYNHASRAAVYGSWILEELERHGYKLSYGTLYPTLHRVEEDGLLVREDQVEGSRLRKYYTATEKGITALAEAQRMIRELYQEVVVEGGGPNPE